MAEHTTYTCDECAGTVSEIYGPLRLRVNGTNEPIVWSGEFCSTDCLAAYVGKKCAQYGRAKR